MVANCGAPRRREARPPRDDEWRRRVRAAVIAFLVPGETRMKTPTLVQNRLYFGIEAMRLRDATDRVLARVAGIPPQRATIGLHALAEDFHLTPSDGRALVDGMIGEGLLERLSPNGIEYGINEGFRALAKARVIPPLPREQAQAVLAQIARAAAHFNRSALSNKYEIDAIAVHGSYMSLDADLPDVSIGVTGRRRAPAARPSAGRGTDATEGTAEIRSLLESHSTYVRVGFHRQLADVPRPFSVVFRAED